MSARYFAMGLLVLGCSSSGDEKTKTQADCDAIAADIRTAAAQKGLQPQGVCASTNPQVVQDFGQACQALKDCNANCCR